MNRIWKLCKLKKNVGLSSERTRKPKEEKRAARRDLVARTGAWGYKKDQEPGWKSSARTDLKNKEAKTSIENVQSWISVKKVMESLGEREKSSKKSKPGS